MCFMVVSFSDSYVGHSEIPVFYPRPRQPKRSSWQPEMVQVQRACLALQTRPAAAVLLVPVVLGALFKLPPALTCVSGERLLCIPVCSTVKEFRVP